MQAARDRLVEAGFKRASLWVLDTNDRARRFYQADGWQADGASKVDDSRGFPFREVLGAIMMKLVRQALRG